MASIYNQLSSASVFDSPYELVLSPQEKKALNNCMKKIKKSKSLPNTQECKHCKEHYPKAFFIYPNEENEDRAYCIPCLYNRAHPSKERTKDLEELLGTKWQARHYTQFYYSLLRTIFRFPLEPKHTLKNVVFGKTLDEPIYFFQIREEEA